ncbi:MAG TPA: hypothetical protein VM166_00570 [Gemmatimonadaceae bacterium]|nr:hypothetical protein [Gemmatimonadaceae bacterium]
MFRVRLTSLPAPRDLEYLALRYLRADGVYEVSLELANGLVGLGYASPDDSADALTDLSHSFNDTEDEE